MLEKLEDIIHFKLQTSSNFIYFPVKITELNWMIPLKIEAISVKLGDIPLGGYEINRCTYVIRRSERTWYFVFIWEKVRSRFVLIGTKTFYSCTFSTVIFATDPSVPQMRCKIRMVTTSLM
jgi:hypothetical protein